MSFPHPTPSLVPTSLLLSSHAYTQPRLFAVSMVLGSSFVRKRPSESHVSEREYSGPPLDPDLVRRVTLPRTSKTVCVERSPSRTVLRTVRRICPRGVNSMRVDAP